MQDLYSKGTLVCVALLAGTLVNLGAPGMPPPTQPVTAEDVDEYRTELLKSPTRFLNVTNTQMAPHSARNNTAAAG